MRTWHRRYGGTAPTHDTAERAGHGAPRAPDGDRPSAASTVPTGTPFRRGPAGRPGTGGDPPGGSTGTAVTSPTTAPVRRGPGPTASHPRPPPRRTHLTHGQRPAGSRLREKPTTKRHDDEHHPAHRAAPDRPRPAVRRRAAPPRRRPGRRPRAD